MSSTARFTPHQQTQLAATAQKIMDSAEATKPPKWLVVDGILGLLGYPTSNTACTLYLNTGSSITAGSYAHRDLVYLKGDNSLHQWWAPLGPDPITNLAHEHTQLIAAAATVDTDAQILWKPDSTMSYRATCTVSGIAPTLTVTFTQSVTGAYLSLALRSTTFSGIKSYDVLVDGASYRVDASQPDTWAVLSNVPAGATILIQPASPEDVQAGDTFYLAPLWVTDREVSPSYAEAFEFTSYLAAWQTVDPAVAKRLMDQIGTEFTSNLTRTISYGVTKPTGGKTGDLWVSAVSTPTLMIYVVDDFYISTEADAVSLFNTMASAVDLSDVQQDLSQAKDTLSQVDADMTQVKTDQQTNADAIAGVQTDVATAQRTLADTRTTLDGVQTDLSQARSDLYDPGGKVDAINTTLTGQAGQISSNTTLSQSAAQQAQDAWNASVAATDAVARAACVVRIDSSKGVMFRQNEVSTVLSVTVFKGDQIITDILSLQNAYSSGAYLEWSWQRYNEDTFGVISSSDPRISNGGFTFTLSPADVDTKVVFRCTVNGDS